MKIGIASHTVIDTIYDKKNQVHTTLGGPPCYCGLTSSEFGFQVELATKVGFDFTQDYKDYLHEKGIAISDSNVAIDFPTTRFKLVIEDNSRKLLVLSRCAPIMEDDIERIANVDCWLVSPVADEISINVLNVIKRKKGKKNFLMLDPQGYTRIVDAGGNVSVVDRLEFDLSGITAIKVDQTELAALTGGLTGVEGMLSLQSRGVDFILATENRAVHLLHGKMHYWINLKEISTDDSTGAGDILSAAFACTYIKEKDPLWAFCFSVGALRTALETKSAGLNKIPTKSKIETSASYYYNTLSFQQL